MNRETLQDRYTATATEALRLVAAIGDKIQDLPAPDSDGITWGHVGDLEWIVTRLKEITGEE